jgi:RNA polymerase sigma-70 factor (ECF subfamily)
MPSAAPDALDQLLAGERSVLVADAVAEMAAPFRDVLTLRFEEEMKLEEIAEVLSLPLGTVKTRLHRALKALQRLLQTKLGSGN